jgi:4-amino-4-deoxy-L-arabinose transferase-like glycosyltransferase
MGNALPQSKQNHSSLILLVLILLLGLTLRLFGVFGDLPFIYDTDEPAFVDRAFRILATGDLNPHWFGHPGTFTIYSLALFFGLFGALGLASGHFPDLASIAAAAQSDPSTFYLIGRALILSFALATLVILYLLARRVAGSWVALLATLLLALSPLHVQLSSVIRTDIQQTFLLVVVAWLAVAIAREGRWLHYLLAGFVLGLAIATKYPAVIGAFMIMMGAVGHMAHRQVSWSIPLFRLTGSALATVLGTFLASPFLFLDFGTAWSNVVEEARPTHLSATNPGFLDALVYYLFDPIAGTVTIAGLALAVVGGVVLSRRSKAEAAIVLGFPLIYLIFISSLSLVWARWATPILPFFALLTATGLGALVTVTRPFSPSRTQGFVTAVLVFALLALPFSTTTTNVAELIAEDTRTVAFHWAMENLPAGSNVLLERYTPQIDSKKYQVFEVSGDGRISAITRNLKFARTTRAIGALEDVTDLYTHQIQYVILGNDYDRRLIEYGQDGKSVQPYIYIMQNHELVFLAEPEPRKRRGNVVRVYRVLPRSDEAPASPLL